MSNRASICSLTTVFFLSINIALLSGCGGDFLNEPASDTSPLNDTGRTSCANLTEADTTCNLSDFPAQDGLYGRDFAAQNNTLAKKGGGMAGFDFTKLNTNGADLSLQNKNWLDAGSEAQGTRWSCVRDNNTGLVWEIKDSSPTHARYALNTYSWYNPASTDNGGLAGYPNKGICNQNSCDTKAYIEYVNSIALCGFSNWRLPNVGELLSIAHQGRVDPAIDTNYFPGRIGLRHWTSSPHAAIPQLAWYVYFSDGSISYTDKSNGSYIRLVR